MSQKRVVASAYLAEHRLETILSHALNAVVGLSPTDIVLALGISLRRHAQSAQSHAEVESTLHHAALLAANEAEARAVVAKVAQQQKTTLAKPGGANKFPELQMALAMVRPA